MEAPANGAREGGGVSRFLTRRTLVVLVLAVLAVDILAYLVVLGLSIAMTRRRDVIPGRLQNAAELAYESLENFALSLGGERARPYVPWFAGLFIFIVAGNWIGLVPPVGKLEELRAPTSDVNVTLGLALVSFTVFQVEGFRALGVGGYLGKFFPLYEFKNGVGAGIIALFVGLIELLLEFIKPVTLSMRLFGNIYGGEVALGVVTGLTVAILPVALYGLEFLLNLVQALIFSVLSLMFILIATEGHEQEEGHLADEVVDASHDMTAPTMHTSPSGA